MLMIQADAAFTAAQGLRKMIGLPRHRHRRFQREEEAIQGVGAHVVAHG